MENHNDSETEGITPLVPQDRTNQQGGVRSNLTPKADKDKKEDMSELKPEEINKESSTEIRTDHIDKYLGLNLLLKEKHYLMQTKRFNDLFNTITIIEGAFGVMLEETLHLTSKDYSVYALNKPTGNFSCVGLQKQVRTVETGENQYIGCNKKYIDEKGSLMTDQIINDFTRNQPDKFAVPTDVIEKVCHFSLVDSHVSYIYNMLTTWLYTLIYEFNGAKETIIVDDNLQMVVKLKKPCYEDSHCRINYDKGGDLNEINVNVPFYKYVPKDLKNPIEFKSRSKNNFFELQNVVLLPNNKNIEQISFYLGHLHNRKAHHELVNFDIGFETDKTIFVIDYHGIRSGKFITDYNLVLEPCKRQIRAHTMLLWIIDYAQVNRLYYDFSLALEILFRSAFWPVPETQEGCIWPQRGILTIGMPSFSPLRACFPNLLQGEVFMKDGVYQFDLDNPRLIKSQMVLAALENYALIYALQTQIYVRTHRCKTWYAAMRSVDAHRHIAEGWDIYNVLFTQVYKCKLLTNMSVNGFITFSFYYTEAERVFYVKPKEGKESYFTEIEEYRQELINAMYTPLERREIRRDFRGPVSRTTLQEIIDSDVLANELLLYFTQNELDNNYDYYSTEGFNHFYIEYLKRYRKKHPIDSFFVTLLPSWVSGALLDGSISSPSIYNIGLTPRIEFNGLGYWKEAEKVFNVTEALKITQVLRYFNRDTYWSTFEADKPSIRQFRPWANVHTRIIEPCSVIYNSHFGTFAFRNCKLESYRTVVELKKNAWSLIQDGFSLSKDDGTYICVHYKQTREARTEFDFLPLQVSSEMSLIASFSALPGRVTNMLGYNVRAIEEPGVSPHFQNPGLVSEDPTTLVTGEESQQ